MREWAHVAADTDGIVKGFDVVHSSGEMGGRRNVGNQYPAVTLPLKVVLGPCFDCRARQISPGEDLWGRLWASVGNASMAIEST